MEISEFRGVGPKKQEAFEKIGIRNSTDLLTHFPHAYQDRSHITRIAEAVPGREYLMEVTVTGIRSWRAHGYGRRMTEIMVTDGTGNMKLIFFVSSYFLKNLKQGTVCRVYGKAEQNGSLLQMSHPDIETGTKKSDKGIIPVYHTVRGISQNQMRDMVRTALEESKEDGDFIPGWIREKRKLAGHSFAMENIHFPSGRKAWAAARYRLEQKKLFVWYTKSFFCSRWVSF